MAENKENQIQATKRDSAPAGNNTFETRAAVQDNWNKLWADRMQAAGSGKGSKWIVTLQLSVEDYDLALEIKNKIDALMAEHKLSDVAITNMRIMR